MRNNSPEASRVVHTPTPRRAGLGDPELARLRSFVHDGRVLKRVSLERLEVQELRIFARNGRGFRVRPVHHREHRGMSGHRAGAVNDRAGA